LFSLPRLQGDAPPSLSRPQRSWEPREGGDEREVVEPVTAGRPVDSATTGRPPNHQYTPPPPPSPVAPRRPPRAAGRLRRASGAAPCLPAGLRLAWLCALALPPAAWAQSTASVRATPSATSTGFNASRDYFFGRTGYPVMFARGYKMTFGRSYKLINITAGGSTSLVVLRVCGPRSRRQLRWPLGQATCCTSSSCLRWAASCRVPSGWRPPRTWRTWSCWAHGQA
jgi:hypothetical protein